MGCFWFFFFKQKTAYEMRISDWSSDVCSSDLEHLPADLHGHAADLGAGWGYLSVELLQRCPGITALDLFEAEARALELARVNLAPFATRAKLGFHWHDVTAGLAQRFDVIVTNPPFHAQGNAARPDIGRSEEPTSELQSLMR